MTFAWRLVLAASAGSALIFLAPPAMASDAHFTGDDVRIMVDDAGRAQVEHALTYHVYGALPKGLDLAGVENEATLDPVAAVELTPPAPEGASPVTARSERKGDRAVHVTLDGGPRHPGGHAVLVVRVRYALDLVAARELSLDGAMWRLAWTAPAAPEGYDSARVIFDLPAAPTEPRAAAAGAGDETATGAASAWDDGQLVTLRRGARRDELELSRPHVAHGEAATWAARVDPRAFPQVVDPVLHPAAPVLREAAPARGVSGWIVAAIVGLLFAAIARGKQASFGAACEARGVVVRGLVARMPESLRPWLAGLALGAGVGAEIASYPGWGALGVVVAMVLATSRASRPAFAPRGPGQWLPLSPGEAFARDRERDLLAVTTLAGKATLLATALGSIALGLGLRPIDATWIWLAPLDALALLPLFITGSRAQLPPDRVRSPARRLASLHRLLRRDGTLRVTPWARVPTGASVPDELRLLVLPRAAIPGVVGIELGVAWVATPAGYAPETEVLVRVREASAAAARMVALAAHRPIVHGRKTDERVVRLVPALPSRAAAAALVRRLARELHDRRKSLPSLAWSGSERRLPPNERLRAAPAPASGGVVAAAAA
jgi:hypothetical protein